VSDYLSHLAGRSLGPTNTVRPRSLPVFDPLPPIRAAEWREPPASALAASAPPVLDLEWKSPANASAPNSRLVNRPPPAPATARLESDPLRIPGNDDIATAPAERRPGPAEITREDSSAEHPTASSTATRDAPHSLPPAIARERENVSLSPSGLESAAAEEEEQSVRGQEKILVLANSPQRGTRPAETSLVAVRSSPVRPAASMSARPRNSSQSLPVESAINVTIGRVEIRATLPPPLTQTPRRNVPIVGLEEYLRQRAKGAGR